MHRQIILVLALLGLSLSAAADFRTIAEAYEVEFSSMRLPGSQNGTLTFKPCIDCDAQTLRVSVGTRYAINGRSLPLTEFKVRLKNIKNRQVKSVTVLHHLETNMINEIDVWYR